MRRALVAAVLASGVIGCSSSPQRDASRSPAPADTSPPAAAIDTAAALATIESVSAAGEDLYDIANAKQWAKAGAVLSTLQASTLALRGPRGDANREMSALDEAVAAVAHDVEVKDRAAGMRDANEVTWYGAQLAGALDPPVPVSVARLDYYGRALVISSESGDLMLLRGAADGVRRDWTSLRPMVEARGGAKEAAAFGALVTRLDAAKTPAEFGRLATPILDEVDNLERVFARR